MSATSAPPNLRPTRLADVIVVLAAAPVLLLVGVPAAGYLVGTATWILLRVLGLLVDHHATSFSHVVQQASLRLTYRTLPVVLLVLAAVLTSKVGGRDDGLAALLVIIIAFTIELTVAIAERSGPR